MDTKTQLDELLTRTMDRKQFIQHLGIGMLVLFGLGSLLKLLAANQQAHQEHGSVQLRRLLL